MAGSAPVSFTLTIQCPTHPAYQAKAASWNGCKCCNLMFAVRNNTNRVLSVPREERTDANEVIIKELA